MLYSLLKVSMIKHVDIYLVISVIFIKIVFSVDDATLQKQKNPFVVDDGGDGDAKNKK